jgi:hypothetical protein
MARVLRPDTPVRWLRPTLALPGNLAEIQPSVLAVPMRVRGGGPSDPFTRDVLAALHRLRTRGCAVFVAQGPHPNPLGAAGTPVRATAGPGGRSASEACVAAAEAAFISRFVREECRHG